MPEIPEDIIHSIFMSSFEIFLDKERQEIIEGVNERNNCARWAKYLEQASKDNGLSGYIADAEYNRKQNGQIKTVIDGQGKVVTINCDLILHTRGEDIAQDNLIAIEVKKHDRPEKGKQSDRERLRALTKESYDGIWMNDGSTPPKHVCGYRLGVFVELNRKSGICHVEYYKNGEYESDAEYSF
jgi:hypothetical protein